MIGPKTTPGPWHWHVNEKARSVQLMNGRSVYVMGFDRWGTQSAQPTFALDGIMRPVKDLLVAFPGQEHNRAFLADVDHPDARLIAAAPKLLELCVQALAFHWRYEGAHKICVFCGGAAPPSTRPTDIEHDAANCPVPKIRAALKQIVGEDD